MITSVTFRQSLTLYQDGCQLWTDFCKHRATFCTHALALVVLIWNNNKRGTSCCATWRCGIFVSMTQLCTRKVLMNALSFDTMLMLKVKLKTLQIFLYLGIYNIYEKLLPGSHKGIKKNSRLNCVLACFMIYLPDSLFSKLSL